MTIHLDFYFDVGSPTAYLAHKRLQQLVTAYDLAVHYQPMLLGGIFKATGNTTPVAIPAKGAYMLHHDLPRFAERYQVALNFNPHFPINTLPLMRGAVAARQLHCFEPYVDTVFDAIWIEGKNLGEPTVATAVLVEAGLDADAITALCADAGVKKALIDATDSAVEKGVFGAPTFFIGDDMYFGQDRLDFVEQLLNTDNV